MNQKVRLTILAHILWVAVGVFWFFTTRDFHPTTELAVIVTTSLVVAFVVAADINHFILIPRYWGRPVIYFPLLLGVMCLVTAVALTVIRVSYYNLHGPDADPYGAYKHFAIDLVGVAVHVAVAAGVVWAWRLAGRKLS